MTMTDPIADLITRIRNAYKAKHIKLLISYSNIKNSVLKVLKKEGYILDYENTLDSKEFKYLNITLKYSKKGDPALVEINRISKPGKRIYTSFSKLKDYYQGLGIFILTTSKGVVSSKDLKNFRLGGEIICNVF